ncbi:PAS domain S-box protein [Teredinibacter haidensis]|uniref:PAS domain S-box protein n=1 Tax=Teredinibacter haidensis TaxID=2731755 RepID=UPI000948E6AA|nr:PAS domain S-box protein [Teredinibacter haidensis]
MKIQVSTQLSARFSKIILGILLLFFLVVLSATLVLETLRVMNMQKQVLDTSAKNILNIIDLRLNASVTALTRASSSALTINSLVDMAAGGSYFKFTLNDLTFNSDIDQAVLFDYAGEMLQTTTEKPPEWFSRDLVSSVVALGKQGIKFDNGSLYLISPINYYDTAQGGIAVRVDFKALIDKVMEGYEYRYAISLSNGWTHSLIPEGFDGTSHSVALSEESLLFEFQPTLTLAANPHYVSRQIVPWFTRFTVLGVFMMLGMVVLTRRIGRRMAAPIVLLTQRVNDGVYPVAPLNTNDELDILAEAFDRASFELRKAYAEKYEIEKKERENQVRAIVDTVLDGIITIDSSGGVETFNPAAERIFGYQASEVIGHNVKMLMPEPYHGEHDGYLHNFIESSVAKIIGIGREVKGLRKNGDIFPMELAVSQMYVGNRRLFAGIVRDITERKQNEKLKGEFVSTVSHELRTPLTSIRGALGLVLGKSGVQLPGKYQKLLEVAHRNSERLTILINDLLDMEKLESGKLEFKLEVFDAVHLVKQSLEDNEGFASRHGVNLNLDYAGDSVLVEGDFNRVLQVMANLLSNAIKFSPEEETVSVHIKTFGSKIEISVTDKGSGIPKKFQSRIFERFAQVDSSDTREKGGTGLGLSITKAIVEQLHGEIEFESVEGEGTTFRVFLPVVQEQKDVVPESNDFVLICEDDVGFADFLAGVVNSEGRACRVAHTVSEAEQHLASGSCNLMLLDLVLPDKGGLEWLKELRADDKTIDLPVIVVSAFAVEEDNDHQYQALNVLGCLQKPLDVEVFRLALHKALVNTSRPKILHVEDDSDIIDITTSVLENLGEIVPARSLAEAKKLLATEKYSLIILDLDLPDARGEELLDEFSEVLPPVVVFSAQPLCKDALKKWESKVVATLMKSVTTNEQLANSIRRTLNSTNQEDM